MFQNLCVRAVIPAAVAVTGFVVICCLLLYAMIKEDLVKDTVNHSTTLANTLVRSTRYAMLHDDRATLNNLILNVGEQQGVEHVRIFNKKGLIAFSTDQREVGRYVDKNTAGCIQCHEGEKARSSLDAMQHVRSFTNAHGDKVSAVTAMIYNEPACTNGACHVHSSEQQLLGILDVGLDQAPLLATLAALRFKMILFTVMVLCLTLGGIAALLCRTIFLPIRTLTDFAGRAANGEKCVNLPDVCGELEALATHMQRIEHRRQHVETKLQQLLPVVCQARCGDLLDEYTCELNHYETSSCRNGCRFRQ